MHRRWTVGALSDMLGIAGPTLRTWERRYGVGPTFRTVGGHRRYTIVDADRVATMARFIDAGMPASDAAERVKAMSPQELALIVGSGAEGLRAAAREHAMAEIIAGARSFDGASIEVAAEAAIDRFGLENAWDSVIAPVMIEVGRQWEDGLLGVAGEHLVTTRVLSALRATAHQYPTTGPSRVVLASFEDEQHKLPIVAVGAALAGHGHSWTELGARLPLEALEAFVEASQPAAVFLWSSVVTPTEDDLGRLRKMGEHSTVLLGGPGWPPGVATSHSLSHAVKQLRVALGEELP